MWQSGNWWIKPPPLYTHVSQKSHGLGGNRFYNGHSHCCWTIPLGVICTDISHYKDSYRDYGWRISSSRGTEQNTKTVCSYPLQSIHLSLFTLFDGTKGASTLVLIDACHPITTFVLKLPAVKIVADVLILIIILPTMVSNPIMKG